MKNKNKLAILSVIAIISAIPIMTFLFFIEYSQWYIQALLFGKAGIKINVEEGWLDIYSLTVRIFPLRLSFVEIILLLSSIVVCILSLAFIAKILYTVRVKHQSL